MGEACEYVIYCDESGDHNLVSPDPTYPVFVLVFCIFKVEDYINSAAPSLQAIKFRHFGHDMVVLHETDIRKASGSFAFLTNSTRRNAFMEDMNSVMVRMPMTVVATVIRKDKLVKKYTRASNPYYLSLTYGLERIHKFLCARGQSGKRAHVIAERRGKKEDSELETEFAKICDGENYRKRRLPLKMVLADKKVNSCGLQIADLIARPIGRYVINPSQPNRAFEIIKEKLDKNAAGNFNGWGLKVFP